MDRLETRELAYFTAVAEELHFGRAAERLGIAQPPLSRAISRLERRVGAPLLNRTSRSVSLTAAGEVFLKESLGLLSALDRAVIRTQRAYRGGPLSLATNPGTGSGLLRDLVAAYTAAPASGEVRMVFTRDQARAVRSGEADITLLCEDSDLTGLEWRQVATEKPFVLLPAGHRLAGSGTVGVAELRAEDTFRPHPPLTAIDELIDLVALGQLIVVVGESAAERTGRTVVSVPVSDVPPSRLLLAWRSGRLDPPASAFLRVAERLASDDTVRAVS